MIIVLNRSWIIPACDTITKFLSEKSQVHPRYERIRACDVRNWLQHHFHRMHSICLTVHRNVPCSVKAPTTEDDKKLDRLICYLRATSDVSLRLGCTTQWNVAPQTEKSYCCLIFFTLHSLLTRTSNSPRLP